MPKGASKLSPEVTGTQKKLLCDTVVSFRGFSLMDEGEAQFRSERVYGWDCRALVSLHSLM